jgi:hypothetical protein
MKVCKTMMFHDSLTYNNNPLPPDNISLFKGQIFRQDEIPDMFSNQKNYIGNTKDVLPSVRIKQTSLMKESTFCPSLFHSEKKQIVKMPLSNNQHIQSDGFIFLMMLCFLILTIIIFIKNKKITQYFHAFFFPHYTNQIIREGNMLKDFFVYPLIIVYYTILSFIAIKALHFFIKIEPTLRNVFYCLLVFLCLYVFKMFMIFFVKKTFKTSNETFDYLTNNTLFQIIESFLLFPAVFLLYFLWAPITEVFFFIILVIIILIFIYRTIRSFLAAKSSEQYNLFYFILYLCTVEFLPIIITVKLLSNFYSQEF